MNKHMWSPLTVTPTLAETLIHETGSPAGSAAGALGAAAGRGSWRVCWWRGASGALKRGTPPVCAGGTSASGARRSPEPRPQTGQTSLFGRCRCVCGSVARGPKSCNGSRGWRRLGRSACAVAGQQWSPARRSPCCTQYARWWGRGTSSLTGSACVWDDCCPSWGTSPQMFSGELPEHHSQKWDPNTSLQTGRKCGRQHELQLFPFTPGEAWCWYLRFPDTERWRWCCGSPLVGPRLREGREGSTTLCPSPGGTVTSPGQPLLTDSNPVDYSNASWGIHSDILSTNCQYVYFCPFLEENTPLPKKGKAVTITVLNLC